MNTAAVSQSDNSTAFEYFRKELKRRVGIAIAETKADMIDGRLKKRVAELNLRDFQDYADFLRSLPDKHGEWELFVNCLTTNKTDFFREPEHFAYLTREILPRWREQPRESFNVWSAASSTGEEPYSLSMVLYQQSKVKAFRYSILATDVDSSVLERTKRGVYPISKLQEIPAAYRKDSIAVGTGEIVDWFKIKDQLREALSCQGCNLINTPYGLGKAFDLIMCRNVLIYFTPETIEHVVQGLYEAAKPGGYLLIGHSETLHNVKTEWQYIKPSIYRKKG